MNVTNIKTRRRQARTGEDVIAEASSDSEYDGEFGLVHHAQWLAVNTVAVMRASANPALLASVTLAITDQRRKIVFLEEIGAILLEAA